MNGQARFTDTTAADNDELVLAQELISGRGHQYDAWDQFGASIGGGGGGASTGRNSIMTTIDEVSTPEEGFATADMTTATMIASSSNPSSFYEHEDDDYRDGSSDGHGGGGGQSGGSDPSALAELGVGQKERKKSSKRIKPVRLTLVSFAVTRRAYEAITARFAREYEALTGIPVRFRLSFGGSGTQVLLS